MLQVLEIKDILQDQTKGYIIEGEIKKICIKTKQSLSNVKVHIETEDKEVLFSDYVDAGKVVYPKAIQIINNVVVKQDIFLFGTLFIKISDMIEQQKIDSIKIIIDKSETLRNTAGTF
jgi:hypothetical protein